MCDVRKKLILANVVIEKYKNWQMNIGQVNEEDVLNGFSTTLLMKLLYLSCLFAVKKAKQATTYRKTPFGVLDKWVAFENGPIEDGIYAALSYQPPFATVSYDISKEDGYKYSLSTNIKKINEYYGCKLQEQDNDVLNKLIEKFDLANEKEQIEDGFDMLIETIRSKIDVFSPDKHELTEYLSNLSHLVLWNAASNRNAKILATDNIYLLKDEYKKLEKKITVQAA
jgi:hypothetical protein